MRETVVPDKLKLRHIDATTHNTAVKEQARIAAVSLVYAKLKIILNGNQSSDVCPNAHYEMTALDYDYGYDEKISMVYARSIEWQQLPYKHLILALKNKPLSPFATEGGFMWLEDWNKVTSKKAADMAALLEYSALLTQRATYFFEKQSRGTYILNEDALYEKILAIKQILPFFVLAMDAEKKEDVDALRALLAGDVVNATHCSNDYQNKIPLFEQLLPNFAKIEAYLKLRYSEKSEYACVWWFGDSRYNRLTRALARYDTLLASMNGKVEFVLDADKRLGETFGQIEASLRAIPTLTFKN
jgi:hypothetical protein